MSATIVKPNTLDTTLVNFSEPIANSHGGKSVKVGYADEGKLLIQAPTMVIPWDLTKEEIVKKDAPPSKDGKPVSAGVKYSFQLSFRGIDANDAHAKRLNAFHDMLKELDELLVETASANSAMWLKMKSAPRPVVEALINPTIKVSKDSTTQEPDGKYPDSIRVKVPFYNKDNNLGCQIFDKDSNYLNDISVLGKFRKGTQVACILECAGVYFSNGKFGFTWSLNQCVIKSESSGKIPRGVCLITDSDDEDDEGASATISHKPAVQQVSFSKNLVQSTNDSDDLDGGDEPNQPVATKQPEPVVVVAEPAPTTQKKVVRRAPAAVKK